MENRDLLEKMVELLTSIDGRLEYLTIKADQTAETLENIQGEGVYNTISDVCDKLEAIEYNN